MLKPATNTWLNLAKQELSNKPIRLSGLQCIRPVASIFRPAAFNTSNLPCRYQPNRSPMNETENRGINPADETLIDLKKQIQKLVTEDKRTKWQSAVDNDVHRTGMSYLWRLGRDLSGNKSHNSPNKGVRFADKINQDPRFEWKLPLRVRITYRHCRQPKLSNFLYSSNRLFGGGAPMPALLLRPSASVCRRCRS